MSVSEIIERIRSEYSEIDWLKSRSSFYKITKQGVLVQYDLKELEKKYEKSRYVEIRALIPDERKDKKSPKFSETFYLICEISEENEICRLDGRVTFSTSFLFYRFFSRLFVACCIIAFGFFISRDVFDGQLAAESLFERDDRFGTSQSQRL